jgi:hypothetical protein
MNLQIEPIEKAREVLPTPGEWKVHLFLKGEGSGLTAMGEDEYGLPAYKGCGVQEDHIVIASREALRSSSLPGSFIGAHLAEIRWGYGEESMAEAVANAKLMAQAPTLKAENEKLKAENARLGARLQKHHRGQTYHKEANEEYYDKADDVTVMYYYYEEDDESTGPYNEYEVHHVMRNGVDIMDLLDVEYVDTLAERAIRHNHSW